MLIVEVLLSCGNERSGIVRVRVSTEEESFETFFLHRQPEIAVSYHISVLTSVASAHNRISPCMSAPDCHCLRSFKI